MIIYHTLVYLFLYVWCKVKLNGYGLALNLHLLRVLRLYKSIKNSMCYVCQYGRDLVC